MSNRKTKSELQRFTSISTQEGSYELWNSLDSSEEQFVIEQLGLEKGNLPLAKKDEQRQRLLFGKGNFGKVRLANKDGQLYAVKKIQLQSRHDMSNLLKEYNFGKLLKAAKIPHVAYGTDGTVSSNARGQKTFYLFIDKIAALGNGSNLKALLSHIHQPEQRAAILSHAARSLLESAASMHQHQIYHRDIKADNILLSSTGQVYLTDFGSAATTNSRLIASALKENADVYTVSDQSDTRYFSPEFHIAKALNRPLPATSTPVYALLDNWRLGLTLLQLCGAIKEGEGILASPLSEKTNKDGSLTPGWLTDLQSRAGGEELAALIQSHFIHEIEKIKTESMDKIPVEIRDLIFALLEVDCEKRLSSEQALEHLQRNLSPDTRLVDEGFKNLIHSQIAETVKSGIKKALKKEADISPDETGWLNQALEDFKVLLKQPSTTPEDIQNFVNFWIVDDNNRPHFSLEHYEAALERIRKKMHLTQPQQHEAYSSAPAFEPHQLPPVEANQPDDSPMFQISDESTPSRVETAPPTTEQEVSHYSAIPAPNSPILRATPPNHLETTSPVAEQEASHYSAIRAPMKESASEELSSEDSELIRLENNLKRAVDELSAYARSKRTQDNRHSRELEGLLHTMDTGLGEIKKLMQPSHIDKEQERPSLASPVDTKAIKAAHSRIESIVVQLTLEKLMHFTEQEAKAVKHMLEKDRQFLESLTDKATGTLATSDLLNQIDERLHFLTALRTEQQAYISSKPLSIAQMSQHAVEAKTYRAQHKKSHAEFTFSQSQQARAYQLPSSCTGVFRNFVAKDTLSQPDTSGEIHIYTPREKMGKELALSIAALNKHQSALKIYVNGQLIQPKAEQEHKKWFRFFGKENTKNISEHPLHFTIEEVSPRKVSLKK